MFAVTQVLVVFGLVVAIYGAIWFYREVFRFSPGWGFACIVVPFALIAFLARHYELVQKPFRVELVGITLLLLAVIAHSYAG